LEEKEIMELIRHVVGEDEMPEYDTPLLLLVRGDMGTTAWTVGRWTLLGWMIDIDWVIYSVLEWYELPRR
jgi:hypothetical protein